MTKPIALMDGIGRRAGTSRVVPWLWLTVSLGGVLRLATLGRQSLWLDEASSYWIADRPWMDIVAYLPTNDPHPPLYYLVLQPMIALGGGEWLLRLPSALASIAGIGLFYALGAELFDRQTGRLAAFVLAISPLHIWYAQEARMYALVAALTLAAALFAARALRTNHPADWILLALCQGLALWTNTAAIWFTLALNAAALPMAARLWRSRRFWPWLAAQALAVALYLPWLPAFLQQMHGKATWIPPATLTVLARTLADFAGGYERPGIEAALALPALLAGLAVGLRRLVREVPAEPMRYLLIGCWLCVPVGLAFLLSQPYVRIPLVSLIFEPGRSLFLTRNLIVATFPLYILLARSLLLSGPVLLAGILAALVALNGVAYLGNALPERKEDYRAAARVVADRKAAGDLIVFAPPYLELPFAYYDDDRPASRRLPIETLKDGVIAEAGGRIYAAPAAALDDHRRVWLITNANIYQQDTLGTVAAVEARGRLIEDRQVEGVTVRLYAMNSNSAQGTR